MASVNSITHSLEDIASSLERGQKGFNILGNVWGRRKPTCELTPPPAKPSWGLLSEFLSHPSIEGQT